MRALILAAGVGRRLGPDGEATPKCLLRFNGRTLLARHLDALAACGVRDVHLAVGHRAEAIERELDRLGFSPRPRTVFNECFTCGSIVSLGSLLAPLTAGGDVLIMDADVLYDSRILQRLANARAKDGVFLLDRDFEPGEEPVKLCIRDGVPVELRKCPDAGESYDLVGESVGFFRFGAAAARQLARIVEAYLASHGEEMPHEEALRDLLRGDAGLVVGFEDITGLPWIEIDFPHDMKRATEEILPKIDHHNSNIPGAE